MGVNYERNSSGPVFGSDNGRSIDRYFTSASLSARSRLWWILWRRAFWRILRWQVLWWILRRSILEPLWVALLRRRTDILWCICSVSVLCVSGSAPVRSSSNGTCKSMLRSKSRSKWEGVDDAGLLKTSSLPTRSVVHRPER
jgi:hypothetical protein